MLPKALTVGPHAYTVRTGKPARKHLGERNLMGEADHATLTIHVSPDHPESVLAEVLLHELLHCIWDQTPLRVMDDDLEESVVSAFAPLLLATLRNNPAVAALLIGTE